MNERDVGEVADQEGREPEPEPGVGVTEQEDVADQAEDQRDQQPEPGRRRRWHRGPAR